MRNKSVRSNPILIVATALLTLLAGAHVYATYPCILPSFSQSNTKGVDLLLKPTQMGPSWFYSSPPGQRKALRFGKATPNWTKHATLSSAEGLVVGIHAMEFACEAAAIDALRDGTEFILGSDKIAESGLQNKNPVGEPSMTLVRTAAIENLSAHIWTYCGMTAWPTCQVLIQTRNRFFYLDVRNSGRGVDRGIVELAIDGTIDRIRAEGAP